LSDAYTGTTSRSRPKVDLSERDYQRTTRPAAGLLWSTISVCHSNSMCIIIMNPVEIWTMQQNYYHPAGLLAKLS